MLAPYGQSDIDTQARKQNKDALDTHRPPAVFDLANQTRAPAKHGSQIFLGVSKFPTTRANKAAKVGNLMNLHARRGNLRRQGRKVARSSHR